MTATTSPPDRTDVEHPEDDIRLLWAGVPEVGAITSALGKASAALAATRSRPRPAVPSPADLAAALEAGEPLPDLPAVLAERAADDAVLDRELRLLLDTQQVLAGRLAELKRSHADTALAVLADALADVIGQVRNLTPALRRIADAEDAVDADKADEWRQLVSLASRHGRVRARQHEITAAALGGDRHQAQQLIERCGRFRNVEAHEPVRSRIADGPEAERRHRAAVDIAAGAAHVQRTPLAGAPPRYSDPVPYIRWLAGDDVQAWVPSIRELQAKATEIDRLVMEADQARARKLAPAQVRAEKEARRDLRRRVVITDPLNRY